MHSPIIFMTILKDVINHWVKDWKNNKKLFFLEFFGTLLSIVGTVTLSVLSKNPPILIIYSIWIFSSSMLCLSAYKRKASWFFLLMAFNVFMNIVGITVYML